jgi:hypothetical protein
MRQRRAKRLWGSNTSGMRRITALLGRLDDIGAHCAPLLIRSGVVRRVKTGRRRATPISVAFCTM